MTLVTNNSFTFTNAHILRGTTTVLAAGAACYITPALYTIATLGSIAGTLYFNGQEKLTKEYKKIFNVTSDDIKRGPGLFLTLNTIASTACAIFSSNPYISCGSAIWNGLCLAQYFVIFQREWENPTPDPKGKHKINSWDNFVNKVKSFEPNDEKQVAMCKVAINSIAALSTLALSPLGFVMGSAFVLASSDQIKEKIATLPPFAITVANIALATIALYSPHYMTLAAVAQGYITAESVEPELKNISI